MAGIPKLARQNHGEQSTPPRRRPKSRPNPMPTSAPTRLAIKVVGRLKPEAMRLLGYYRDYLIEDGHHSQSLPSINRAAKELALGSRAVRQAHAELVKRGCIGAPESK